MKTEKKYSIPKEFGEKWIEALRSNQYRQGFNKYYNKSDNSYCSMGVAYKANDIEFSTTGISVANTNERVFQSVGDSEDQLWWTLQRMNDVDKLPFTEVASWLEQNCSFI